MTLFHVKLAQLPDNVVVAAGTFSIDSGENLVFFKAKIGQDPVAAFASKTWSMVERKITVDEDDHEY